MKSKWVAVAGGAVLVIAFALSRYLQLVATVLGSGICIAIVIGFFMRGHKTRTFWIPASTPDSKDTEAGIELKPIRIEGYEFVPKTLPPRLEFAIFARNLHMLAAILLIAAGTVVASTLGTNSSFAPTDLESDRYAIWYVLCYALGILSFPVLAWLSECALMIRPGITLAQVHGQVKGGWGSLWIRYHFKNGQGGYYGGSTLNLGGPKDDHLKVVLCNPRNPDINKISCGFLFHRILWKRAEIGQ